MRNQMTRWETLGELAAVWLIRGEAHASGVSADQMIVAQALGRVFAVAMRSDEGDGYLEDGDLVHDLSVALAEFRGRVFADEGGNPWARLSGLTWHEPPVAVPQDREAGLSDRGLSLLGWDDAEAVDR
jgi:hypothetical protein